MERRQFLRAARWPPAPRSWVRSAMPGPAPRRACTDARSWSTSTARRSGSRDLAPKTNYVFQYPLRGHAVLPAQPRPAGGAPPTAYCAPTARRYAWTGGVGPAHSSFRSRRSARTSSPIRRATSRSSASSGALADLRRQRDPLLRRPQRLRSRRGRARRRGPAPQPLAAILLEYDGATDERRGAGHRRRRAVRCVLPEVRLQADDGVRPGQGAAMPVGATTVVRELTQYCRQTIQC